MERRLSERGGEVHAEPGERFRGSGGGGTCEAGVCVPQSCARAAPCMKSDRLAHLSAVACFLCATERGRSVTSSRACTVATWAPQATSYALALAPPRLNAAFGYAIARMRVGRLGAQRAHGQRARAFSRGRTHAVGTRLPKSQCRSFPSLGVWG